MRQALAIIALVWIGFGCSKEKPPAQPPSQPSGLKLNPKPEVKRGPNSPEALARAFQQTLAENNAEAMMMLSLLGYGTNAWLEFSQATLVERRRVITKELAQLEAKPRPQRTEPEQARLFSLKLQLSTLEKTHAAGFNALHNKLPIDRKRFKEQEYHALQQALREAHMVQDTMKLAQIDTSGLTLNFLDAKLHGGPLELRYTQDGQSLPSSITFNCADLKGIGWVILDPPRVSVNRQVGPQLPPSNPPTEPFPAPGSGD